MEHVAFSWYEGTEARKPSKGVTIPKYTKPRTKTAIPG